MPIHLLSALRFPYLRANLLSGWIVPTALILFVQIGAFFTMVGIRQLSPSLSPNTLVLITVPFTLFLNIILGGFFWHMAGTLRETHDLQEPLPDWMSHFKAYVKDGAKLFLYLMLLNIVMNLVFKLPVLTNMLTSANSPEHVWVSLLLLIGLGILFGPVFSAPIIFSANTYRLKDLFNFQGALQLLKHHYKTGLMASIIGLPVFFLYALLVAFMMNERTATFFLPLVLMPMLVTLWHLMIQGLAPEFSTTYRQIEST